MVVSTKKTLFRFQNKLSNRFLQNLAWLGGSQMLNRVVRLGTTATIARLLSPTDYGLAAVVLTAHEFINVFTRGGIVTKLIQAPESELEACNETAYWLNWILCGSLFVLQCVVAFPVSEFYGNRAIALPLIVMAFIYLMLPFACVQAALNIRENRLRVAATADSLQFISDCALTVIFALLGFGAWAIVLPKVLVAPIWVVINRENHSWRPSGKLTLTKTREIMQFGRHILGVELLSTARNHADYLLIGRFLGLEALGVYYFAFNAGLGISLSLIGAFNSALFPWLCAVNQDLDQLEKRFLQGLKTLSLIAVPIILLQCVSAPVYVPLVFGEKWIAAGALPVLIIICLSALPRPFAEAASQLTRALDQPRFDSQWNIIFTGILLMALLIGVQSGLLGVAIALLIAHLIAMPIFTLWTTRHLRRTRLASKLLSAL